MILKWALNITIIYSGYGMKKQDNSIDFVAVASNYCDLASVKPLLDRLNTSFSERNSNELGALVIDFDEIQSLISSTEDFSKLQIVLLYGDLAYTLSQAVQTSPKADLDTVVENWKRQTEELQRFYRTHREQVLLFNIQDVQCDPQAFLDVCWEKWGQGEFPLAIALDPPVDIDPIFFWVAEKILDQDSLLQEGWQYLKALTWPLGYKEKDIKELDIDWLLGWRKYYDLRIEKEEAVAAISLERDALIEKLRDSADKLSKSTEKHTLDTLGLEKENKLLLEQLFLVQEELETKVANFSNKSKENKELIDKLSIKEKEFNDFKLNQKKQIEKINSEFLENKKLLDSKKDIEKENSLLLEQLFLVQEELETYYLKNADLSRDSNQDTESKNSLGSQSTGTALMVVPTPVASQVVPTGFFERRQYKKEKRKAYRIAVERAALIEQSPWFDKAWYLSQYQDIAADAVQSKNPALHYMRQGGFEGRNPSPHFDSAFYLESNPDVAQAKINPLWHFLKSGQAEGRQPYP